MTSLTVTVPGKPEPLAAQRARATARTVADRQKAAGLAHCLDLIDTLRGRA